MDEWMVRLCVLGIAERLYSGNKVFAQNECVLLNLEAGILV